MGARDPKDANRSADRRRTGRQRVRIPVRFWWGELEGRGFTADVSDTGLFVQTSMKVEPGTRLHLELELDGEPFYAEAVVARKRIFPQYARTHFKSGIGLRLLDLGEARRRLRPSAGEPAAEALPGRLEVDLRDPRELERVYRQDLRHGGLLVRTDDPPAVHDQIAVRLLLPEPHEPFEVQGTVLHVMPELPGLAMQVANTEAVNAHLSRLLEAS